MRELAILPAGQKDYGELKALGGVQSHHGDHTSLGIWDLVSIGHQRHLFQECLQRTGRSFALLY